MEHRPLTAALRAFAEEAAMQLAADVQAGAEVPFELAEERASRRSTPLYCYRPLTDVYIRDRWARLAGLGTYAPALGALARREGIDAWLHTRTSARPPRGERERARAALETFLDALFEDSSDFDLDHGRLGRLCDEIEACTTPGAARTATLVAAVPGLRLAGDRLPLAEDLALLPAERFPGAPEDAAWIAAAGEHPNVLAALTLRDADGADAAAGRLRALVRALRLYGPGAVGLAPVAWVRTDDGGPWRMVWLDGSPARPGPPLGVPAAQEDELRAFCNLVARRTPRGGELAWALGRFELSCERPPAEALSDVLMALRALLEPEGPRSGLLADRVAALCAEPADHEALAERVAHAESLERAVVGGLAPPAAGVEALADELTGHLRALLRDTLCGHLDSDLPSTADRLLAEAV